jgi:hypothetical protein
MFPARFFDLVPGVIGDLALKSALGEHLRPVNAMNPNAGSGNYWAKAHCNCTKAGNEFLNLNPPVI